VANSRAVEPESMRGSVPVPDPTVLTTKLTKREIAALREIVEEKIQGLRDVLTAQLTGIMTNTETRMGEMDKAILLTREEHQRTLALIQDMATRVVDEKIRAAIGIVFEQFKSIQTQFTERDIRTEQTSRDSKVAVDAALQAAKEAVNAQQIANALSIDKSERATAKQIDQINLTMSTTTKGLEDKISSGNDEQRRTVVAIEARLNRMEGSGTGKQQQLATAVAIGGLILAVVAFFIGKLAY